MSASAAYELFDGDALTREKIVRFEGVCSIFENRQRRRSRNWAPVLFAVFLTCGAFWE